MATPVRWETPEDNPVLSEDVVDIWQAALDQPAAALAVLTPLLSTDELARAHRFHFARDRDHFIVARAVLRTILGRYVAVPPLGLIFTYSALGKPCLGGPFAD
ncbi:MAG: hypothetical protein WCD37_01800 [Chloroflexia bacterium]